MKRRFVRMIATLLALSMTFCLSGCASTKATVQTDGGAVKVSASEICDFSSRYINRLITVTAKVKRVSSEHVYTGTNMYGNSNPRFFYYQLDLEGGWYVYVDKDDPIIDRVNVGDTIEAKGYIKDIWVDVTICGREDGNWSSEHTNVRIVQ